MPIFATLAAVALANCTATDGDTLRCGQERVRLLGIDAPELHGCPPRRRCVTGDGQAARRTLAAAIARQRLTIVRVGEDRYGRTLGVVYAAGQNLSCAMLAAGRAQYIARWDNGALVARDCPTSVTSNIRLSNQALAIAKGEVLSRLHSGDESWQQKFI